MKPSRRLCINALLIVGAFTTMATSLQHVSVDARETLTLAEATPLHFSLAMDEEVVRDSTTIDLTVDAQAIATEVHTLRIVPDDESLAVAEYNTDTTLSYTFENLKDLCPVGAPCSLGFTLEIVSGPAPLEVQLFASAFKEDQGGMCNKAPKEYSSNAVLILTVDQ